MNVDDNPMYEPFLLGVGGNQIFFTGPVTPASSLGLKTKLYEMASSGFPWINLHLQSPGGDSFSAYSIYDHIKSLSIPVNTVADGECESAATIIFMAGTNRFIMPNAVFRPHQGRFTVIGSPYDAAMDEALNWKKDETKARQIYLDETERVWRSRGQQTARRLETSGKIVTCEGHRDCIVKQVEREIELNAQEVVDFGYADGVWTREVAKDLVLTRSPKDDYIERLQSQIRHLERQCNKQQG